MPRESRVNAANSLKNAYNFTTDAYVNNEEGFDIQKKLGKQYVKETANKGGKSGE